ncbi:MAG: hypothetical protein AAAB13_16095, partial [Pseudomonas sp.]
ARDNAWVCGHVAAGWWGYPSVWLHGAWPTRRLPAGARLGYTRGLFRTFEVTASRRVRSAAALASKPGRAMPLQP